MLVFRKLLRTYLVDDPYPVLYAFHSFHASIIPIPRNLPSDYDVENAMKIYIRFRDKIGRWTYWRIKTNQECFLQQCFDYFTFISYRKEKVSTNLEVTEQKLLQLQTRQGCTVKRLKEAMEQVHTPQRQCNNSVTLYGVFQACHKIFPDVAIALEIIIVCPSSWAVVERGFLWMNLMRILLII